MYFLIKCVELNNKFIFLHWVYGVLEEQFSLYMKIIKTKKFVNKEKALRNSHLPISINY